MAGIGRRLERTIRVVFDADLPPSPNRSRFVAPLPTWLEDVGLRLAWPIAIVNLVGTAFGFWYYRFQLEATPLVAWPLVPDSPLATLFIALSLIAWRLDLRADWLHVLAFFGCIKLGLWTPFVQLVVNGPSGIATWLYVFLITSHFAMAFEAFLIHRYAEFTLPAIGTAAAWYGLNDLVDYFWPVFDGPHHTTLRAEFVDGAIDHTVLAHDLAAGGAVVLTLSAIVLALGTHRSQTDE